MWRLIVWFVIAAALAWGLTWLAGHPGTITVEWLGWRVEEMPVALALGLLLAGVLVVLLALRLLRWLIGSPFAIADYLRGRRRRKAQEAIASGVTALLAGNTAAARKAASQAARLVPGEPLARLLQGQTALAAGELNAARFHFESLKDDATAEAAALHGLYEIAVRRGDMAAARAIARDAHRRHPDLPWAAQAMLRFTVQDGDWPAVRQLLAQMRRAGIMDKAEEKRLQAVALTAEAQAEEDTQPDNALQLALQAHRLDPALVPAALVAGRLLAQQGKLRKAARVLQDTWKRAPHPDIAEVYAHLRSGDSPQDRLERVRELLKVANGGEEGAVALARAAIDAREWDTALGALRPWLNEQPSARIFLLMAELEEARSGDIGRMREWLSRARRARPGPAWVAQGMVSPVWLPATPDGMLGAFRWQEPPQAAAALPAAEPVPEELLAAPQPGTHPASAPEEEARLVEARVRSADEMAAGPSGSLGAPEKVTAAGATSSGSDGDGDSDGTTAADAAAGDVPVKADKAREGKVTAREEAARDSAGPQAVTRPAAAATAPASATTGQPAATGNSGKARVAPAPAQRQDAPAPSSRQAASGAAQTRTGRGASAPEAAVAAMPPRGAEAVADLPEEEVVRPPLPDDPGPLPAEADRDTHKV